MIDLDYAASQLGAVWRMAWNWPGWADSLDRSVDGVFKSFWAIALTAPLTLLDYFSSRRVIAQFPELRETPLLQAPFAIGFTVEFIGFLLSWAAGLVVLVYVARLAGASARAADLIIGYNWLHVYIGALQAAPLALMSIFGARQTAALLAAPATILTIALLWGLLRRTIGAGIARTISILLLLIFVGVAVSLLIDGIARFFL